MRPALPEADPHEREHDTGIREGGEGGNVSEISRWEDKGREFLEESPLLSWAAIQLPGTMKQLDATRPRLTCKPCAGGVPFALSSVGGIAFGRGLSESVMSPQPLYRGPQLLRYVCTSCEKTSAEFFIEIEAERVRKLGQRPPWTINVSKRVAEFLGDDLSKIYKNGLVCESQGLGIAAFAYYRRVLEDTIDRLLDAIQEAIDDAGERERYADVMKKCRAEKNAAERISLAKEVLPSSLRPEGINPLSALHEGLSQGLHSWTEENCLRLAGSIRNSLEFLLAEIGNRSNARKTYLEGIRNVLEKKKEKA